LRLWAALVLAVVMPLGSLPFSAPDTASADDGWDYAADRDALLGQLPADPAQAAMALVDDIYGDDFTVASMATMELLRRSGIPILNLEDKVVALPSDIVLPVASVAGELVPTLTRSVRAADFYTLDEFDSLLVDSGLFVQPLPIDGLAGALGQWGKPSSDAAAPPAPPEVVTAGAAVRALGAKRGQVYYSAAVVADHPEAVTLDVLQVVLIFGHLGSPTYRVVRGTGGSGPLDALFGVGTARAAELASNCETGLLFYDQMEQKPWWLEGMDQQVYEFLMSALKEASDIPNSIPKPSDLIGGEIKVKGVKIGADKISAIITTILWIAGIRLELAADPKDTHFGPAGGAHKEANAGKDVTVTAHVHFQFPGSAEGLSANAVACLKLLTDVEAFENKPLAEFKVRWSMEQPQTAAGQGKLLVPLRAYENEFFTGGTGGGTTTSSGDSKVVLEPAYERNPGQGTKGKGTATVIASVDKEDMPLKLKDLIGLTNPTQFAVDKIFDLANSAIRRLGLPKQRIGIPVEYHGGEIITIEGETTLFALYYFLPVKVKLWTCDGLKGHWQGTTGFNGDRNAFGDIVNQFFDVQLPGTAKLEKQESFNLDLTGGSASTRIMASEMALEIDVSAADNALSVSNAISLANGGGRVIGDAELTIGGQPAGILAIFDGRNATFDVRQYRPGERDDLCPNAGAESYFPAR
jgi:hypothetical protein